MPSFCPSYLPLAVIEWSDFSQEESESPLIFVGFDNYENEKTSHVQFLVIRDRHETQTDFFGVPCFAYFLTIRLDDIDWQAADSFPTIVAAKEFAAYVLWQLRKGNRLAAVPCFLDEEEWGQARSQ
jgi:hypothetical protein